MRRLKQVVVVLVLCHEAGDFFSLPCPCRARHLACCFGVCGCFVFACCSFWQECTTRTKGNSNCAFHLPPCFVSTKAWQGACPEKKSKENRKAKHCTAAAAAAWRDTPHQPFFTPNNNPFLAPPPFNSPTSTMEHDPKKAKHGVVRATTTAPVNIAVIKYCACKAKQPKEPKGTTASTRACACLPVLS